MITTGKASCRILADLLVAHGVRNAVVSPGSRNAPIIVALSRCNKINMYPVVDERSAAFIALGISSISSEPVALVCTSGTALLNYLPAVAEAFYRRVPLIVISADRPEEWIDQDDSQTLRQAGALAPWVKETYDIPASDDLESTRWLATRLINDALLSATSGRHAPVHINIRLDNPLNSLAEFPSDSTRTIRMITPREDITVTESRRLAKLIASPVKVLIIAGFNPPNQKLNKALLKMNNLPNIVIMAESISNLHGPGIIHRVDTALSSLNAEEIQELSPDVIITLGGALISRHIKRFLRGCKEAEHWHVGISHTTIDCFKHLTLRVELNPEIFFSQLSSALQPYRHESDYSKIWHEKYERSLRLHNLYVNKAVWSDLKAFSIFMPLIPQRWNIQLSNGTTVRYFQLFNNADNHRCDCNRGVSGIDGCTSTAIGSSIAYKSDNTLLITGDMSARYDIGALSCEMIPPRLKIIVMCNGGGSIFRFIDSTRDLDEREDFFSLQSDFPLEKLSEAYGFSYFVANNEKELKACFQPFCNEKLRPAILRINTPPYLSAEVLTNYFQQV